MTPQRQSRRREEEATAQPAGGRQDAPADAIGVEPGGPLSVDGILALQRTTGNQAVAGLLARADDGATLAREAAPAQTGDAAAAAQELRGPQTMTGLKMPITADVLAALGVDTGAGSAGGSKDPTLPEGHTYEYKETKGKAFVKGAGDTSDIDPNDVKQGQLADCYLLAAMIAIARKNPEAIRKLITEKADGTYDVTLYEDGWLWGKDAVVVNVTPSFPQFPGGGGPAYAKTGDVEKGDPGKGEADKPELWAMLIEKAYAIHKGGFEDIGKGGRPDVALEALTGKESSTYAVSDYTEDKLAELLEKLMLKGAVTATSRPSDKESGGKGDKKADADGVVTWHLYPVKKIDKAGKTIDLQNPWGVKDLTAFPLSKFKEYFTTISFVEI